MPTLAFDHIALSVKDVNVSAAFYEEVLQLIEIENTASDSKTRWFIFDGGIQLHLIPRPDADIKTNKAVHFALATTQLDEMVRLLEGLQIDYSDWPGTADKSYVRDDGIRQIYFQDPDGYWIEISDDV